MNSVNQTPIELLLVILETEESLKLFWKILPDTYLCHQVSKQFLKKKKIKNKNPLVSMGLGKNQFNVLQSAGNSEHIY